jgi:Trk K+ transport system NAD-binding subunit
MRVVVVGLGTIGSAVKKLLEEGGHNVVSVGRKSGDSRLIFPIRPD